MKIGRRERLNMFGRHVSKKARKASRYWNGIRKPDIDQAARVQKRIMKKQGSN